MTKWEIGQDLIAISDYIGEKEVELRKGNHEERRLANQLRVIRMLVGDLFNQNNDHDFDIICTNDVKNN